MKPIDYDTIAATYDEDTVRWDIRPDPFLAAAVTGYVTEPAVLDLACGTGIWLDVQSKVFPGVRWFGLDASKGMLAKATEKLAGRAELQRGDAARLPYADDTFDFVANRFAFHHFRHKEQTLDEITRVLKPGGGLLIENVAPQDMPGWWGYRYFPDARALDAARFWEPDRLVDALEDRGFGVEATVTRTFRRVARARALQEARSRTVSELTQVEEPQFSQGLARLEGEPEGLLKDELAILRLTARRMR